MKPQGLGKRAEELWDGVLEEFELDSAGLAILEEACRTIDVIETLGLYTRGNKSRWLKLSEEAAEVVRENGIDVAEVHLVINPLIGALAQHRGVLRQLFSQLKLANSKAKGEESRAKSLFDKLEEEFSQ